MASPAGHPDLFFQYHRDIRSSLDGNYEYPTGNRIKEFNKALVSAKTIGSKLSWVERGPGNVGGRTRPILVDPDDPDKHTWWAGSVSGGLWKTINGGATWLPLTDNLPNLSVSSLEMAESARNVIYMGTGEGFGNLGGVDGDGIFKSVDRGTTWEHLDATASNPAFRHVNRLAVDPTNPDVVLAATAEGIFRTADGGATWSGVYSGRHVQDLRAQPGGYNMQIASANGVGILYSTDAGMTWELASLTWSDSDILGRIELAYSPSHPSIAYASASLFSRETRSHKTGFYRSSDGGASWVPTVDVNTTNPVPWLWDQGWYDNTLAVHPFKPDTVFVGGINLWRARMLGDEVITVGRPLAFENYDWLALLRLESPLYDFTADGSFGLNGSVSYLHPEAMDLSLTDYTGIEIRFGQGTQMAHRFWVSETAGSRGIGSIGIPFSEYMYADYVEVPLQVWDTDNNRQLMFSFRDQADDGEFNLIEFNNTGTRDEQSREYIFIHKYDYDAAAPHDSIAQDGGHVYGMLYWMWPRLADGASWHPDSLPNHSLTMPFEFVEGLPRAMDNSEFNASKNVHVDHHDIVPIPIDEAQGEFWIVNANDGGVAVSKDGGMNFVEVDDAGSGYNTAQFYGVAKKPGSPEYIGGTQDNGTWQSLDNPDNRRGWVQRLGGDGFEAVWHATDPDKLMGSVQYSLIVRSVDGGTTWQESRPYDQSKGQFLTTIGSSDMAPNNVYTSKKDGVWYSRDFGETWTLTPITEHWGFGHSKVRVSIADTNVVWAGSGMDSDPWINNRLHVSQDRGESFEATSLPATNRPPETYISGLATHPTETGTAYALFSRYSHPKVLETKDFGQTWNDLSGFDASGVSTNGFPDVAVYELLVMPHATNVMWVGTDIGLFKSRSYGMEWNYAHNGLPAVAVWRIKVRDDEVVVGTHGRGVWTVPLGEVDVAIEKRFQMSCPLGLALHRTTRIHSTPLRPFNLRCLTKHRYG